MTKETIDTQDASEAISAKPDKWVENVDFRGHSMHKLGQIVRYKDLDNYYKRQVSTGISMYQMSRFLSSQLKNEQLSPEMLKLANRYEDIDTMISCRDCGKYLKFNVVGNDLVSKTECEFAGGMQPYTVYLDVPSGKIIFANDFRSLVEVDDGNFDVNNRVGVKKTTEAYAKAGMIHISVGNSCPGVYQNGNEYIVASLYEPEYDDNKSEEENDSDAVEWEKTQPKKFGSIITDLWWYSAMDYDYFLERCKIENQDFINEREEGWSYFVLNVEPGTYAFTDNLPSRDTYGETVIYSNIKKYSERIPLVIENKNFDDTVENSHFMSYVESSKKESYFYGKTFHCLNYMFVTSGGGYDWVHGRISNQTRRSDKPFKVLTQPSYGHERYADILTYKNFPEHASDLHLVSESLAGTGSNYCGPAGDVPENVDPVWLAACMMYINTMVVNFDSLKLSFEDHPSNTQSKETIRENHLEMCGRILDMMCEIGEKRNLFDGTLQDHFKKLTDLT